MIVVGMTAVLLLKDELIRRHILRFVCLVCVIRRQRTRLCIRNPPSKGAR